MSSPPDPYAGERGQAAVYVVLLFPLLALVLAFVLGVGSVENIRARIRAQLDMAALTATQALDFGSLAEGSKPTLVPAEAEALARQYLAANLAGVRDEVAASPAEIASGAAIAVSNDGPAPTVTITVRVPARIPLLGLAGIGPTIWLTLTGSAAARS